MVSEYAGEDGLSGLPKGPRALTASEKLRLIYTTGTVDPNAPMDRGRTFRGVGPRARVIPPSRFDVDILTEFLIWDDGDAVLWDDGTIMEWG